jgi:hypothetical protein
MNYEFVQECNDELVYCFGDVKPGTLLDYEGTHVLVIQDSDKHCNVGVILNGVFACELALSLEDSITKHGAKNLGSVVDLRVTVE